MYITGHTKSTQDQMETLVAENLQLWDELEIIKGVVHKQGKQIKTLQTRLADQTARSMSENIVLGGILGDNSTADDIESRALALGFLMETMGLDTEVVENGLKSGSRMGTFSQKKHRPILIKVDPQLSKSIFGRTANLAGKQNEQGKAFSVNQQLPDSLAEQRREIRQIIKDRKNAEKHLDQQHKSSFLVRNGKVYINGQMKRKALQPPELLDLFVGDDKQKKINGIKFKQAGVEPVKGSVFQAFATTVESMNDVHLAYIKMFQNHTKMDHIIAACSVNLEYHYQDDAEFGAGFRLMNVIRDSKLDKIAIFITRKFGGQHLGPQRFDLIREVAQNALEKLA